MPACRRPLCCSRSAAALRPPAQHRSGYVRLARKAGGELRDGWPCFGMVTSPGLPAAHRSASRAQWCRSFCTRRPSLASRSSVGIGTGPPKRPATRSPCRRSGTTTTFGAPPGPSPRKKGGALALRRVELGVGRRLRPGDGEHGPVEGLGAQRRRAHARASRREPRARRLRMDDSFGPGGARTASVAPGGRQDLSSRAAPWRPRTIERRIPGSMRDRARGAGDAWRASEGTREDEQGQAPDRTSLAMAACLALAGLPASAGDPPAAEGPGEAAPEPGIPETGSSRSRSTAGSRT